MTRNSIAYGELQENIRSNKAREADTDFDNLSKRMSSLANRRNADTNVTNAETNRINAMTNRDKLVIDQYLADIKADSNTIQAVRNMNDYELGLIANDIRQAELDQRTLVDSFNTALTEQKTETEEYNTVGALNQAALTAEKVENLGIETFVDEQSAPADILDRYISPVSKIFGLYDKAAGSVLF